MSSHSPTHHPARPVFQGKPIIGLSGGIGSGKSFVARCFGELGCHVIDSDAQAKAAYASPAVRAALVDWWGADALLPSGEPDRAFIARKVFADPVERRRLEQLLHPIINAARAAEMQRAAPDPAVLAFVWDTPLLFEAGLAGQCDVLVFVGAPESLRDERVRATRGWGPGELRRRENSQWPLDRKREISDHVVSNAADAGQTRNQVRALFPRILEQVATPG